jgi:NAD(P)-dependent dehydrogenase (short-subunit alcohol dehydrogenase family)
MCAPNSLAYSVSKAGVNSLTRALALDNVGFGIRVNGILPGLMDTPLGVDDVVRRRGVDRGELAATRATAVPMGRQGTGWDTANAALFFASDESEFVTGALLAVDGGHTLMVAVVPESSH